MGGLYQKTSLRSCCPAVERAQKNSEESIKRKTKQCQGSCAGIWVKLKLPSVKETKVFLLRVMCKLT